MSLSFPLSLSSNSELKHRRGRVPQPLAAVVDRGGWQAGRKSEGEKLERSQRRRKLKTIKSPRHQNPLLRFLFIPLICVINTTSSLVSLPPAFPPPRHSFDHTTQHSHQSQTHQSRAVTNPRLLARERPEALPVGRALEIGLRHVAEQRAGGAVACVCVCFDAGLMPSVNVVGRDGGVCDDAYMRVDKRSS
jgi:hypothetical protein